MSTPEIWPLTDVAAGAAYAPTALVYTASFAPTGDQALLLQGQPLYFNSGGSLTFTLPSSPPSATWWAPFQNIGEGDLTLDRNTRTIDGQASNVIFAQNEGGILFTDGSNYFLVRGRASDFLRVGITIDGGGSVITTGVKGAIQVDFPGTIVGWSILETAGMTGSIEVEVDKTAGTQTAPAIPNTTTDKISASAPINLSAGVPKGVGPSGVSTWAIAIARWDVIQFNVSLATNVKRVTLWLRVRR